jgi:aminopeptidase N
VHVCRKHLEALLAKEQLDTAERDSMIDAALAEQNAKRDAELAARMAARRQLLLEVTQGQRDQIQQHQQARYCPVIQVHTPYIPVTPGPGCQARKDAFTSKSEPL